MSAERFAADDYERAALETPYWGEHVARYEYAAQWARTGLTLDIACGTAYGVAVLERRGATVIAADIDIEQLVAARTRATRIVAADGSLLPFRDSTFDTVTSFETIEHLSSRSQFIGELRRILRPGGLLILSTPNARYTNPIEGEPTNPFHLHEYEAEELASELAAHFASVDLFGQCLDERYKTPPFEEAQIRLAATLSNRSRLLLWKAVNKTGPRWRERLSAATLRRSFYPRPENYRFESESLDAAPVLLALCGNPGAANRLVEHHRTCSAEYVGPCV